MSHTPHELHEEFPELSNEISTLRATNAHFAKLAEEYHDINRAIHRAETDIEPTTDDHVVGMRRTRMMLKDELYAMLKQPAAG